MVSVGSRYLSVGGNRHSAAADWDAESGLLAFGADINVALWNPLAADGVRRLLSGHSNQVTAIKFFSHSSLILSASADQTLRIWQRSSASSLDYSCKITLQHEKSLNVIAIEEETGLIATGGSDATVYVWKLYQEPELRTEFLQKIQLSPRFFPLGLALSTLERSSEPGPTPVVLAVSGTTNKIHLYAASIGAKDPNFQFCSTLEGHEGWIESLAFARETSHKDDVLLSSASQDKYVRLWRITSDLASLLGEKGSEASMVGDSLLKPLTETSQAFKLNGQVYHTVFEALLVGHEDWVYTTRWSRRDGDQLLLLTSSADNSLAIWSKSESGIWICDSRLGEISAQKGSTTATGSTGGFWIGLWSPDGQTVTSLSRTGSWRLWSHDISSGQWQQRNGISGHVRAVTGITWSTGGEYVLSTSSDQTTRLHSQWRRKDGVSWHELSRPQIHGYDLNCVASLGKRQFISGADEKLLRVFDEPKATAKLLESLCDIHDPENEMLPDTANIPVLGLSNKAVENTESDGEPRSEDSPDVAAFATDYAHPPLEDDLGRHTLWPEREKLYGHGYEISAVAVARNLKIVATACKASSIDHAVIRLYRTDNWQEIKPALASHALTVTSLAFSIDDSYLLSTGRDRKWTVFRRSDADSYTYELLASSPKAHTRMILSCDWAPLNEKPVFVTGGREKSIKLWKLQGDAFTNTRTITTTQSVESVAFLPYIIKNTLHLAAGFESGELEIYGLSVEDLLVVGKYCFSKEMCPSKAVTCIQWRPRLLEREQQEDGNETGCGELAVSSEDTSLRIFSISGLPLQEQNSS